MTNRVTLTKDHTITFDCPKCRLHTKVALDKVGHTYQCQVRCPCGNIFLAEIEFREQTRKLLDLPGSYKLISRENTASNAPVQGDCRIIDISRIGLAFLKNDGQQLRPGEIIRVNFQLDDAEATEICQDCEVRHVKENFVGCRLRTANALLDDYLLA